MEPDNATAYHYRAYAFLLQKKLDKAIADLNEAIHLDPKITSQFVLRSECRLKKSEFDAALKDADEAIRLSPKDPAIFTHRGWVRLCVGKYAAAREDFDEAIRLNPNDVNAFIHRGQLLACCPDGPFRDGVQAFKDARRACELTEWKNATALEILAAAYAEIGDFDGAVKWQKKALEDKDFARESGPDAQERVELYASKKPYRAEPVIDDPTDARQFVARGRVRLFERNDPDRAIKDFDEALRLDPKNAQAYFGRGSAWVRKGEYDKSIKDLSEAIRIDLKNTHAFVNRGIAHRDEGAWAAALADFDESLRLDPKHALALANRAMLRAACADAKFRDANKALADAKRACEMTDWKDGFVIESYAAACAEGGDFDGAVSAQKKLLLNEAYMTGPRGPLARPRLNLYEASQPLRLQGRRVKD